MLKQQLDSSSIDIPTALDWTVGMIRQSTFEKYFAVIAEKFRIRLCQLVGQTNWFPFKRNKVLFKRRLREKLTKSFAQDDIQALIKCDKPSIKCRVVKRRETKAILWIQTFGRKFAPRLDMASNEQTGDIDSADATTNIVSIENRLPEELLPAPCFDRAGFFCGATRRHEPHRVAFQEIQFHVFIFREKVVQHFFTCCTQVSKIFAELIPHFTVLLCSAGQSTDAARLLHRVKRGEIAKLHGETARRASHLRRDLNDQRIAFVKLSELQFAIDIQRDEKMLACPFYWRSLCHAARLPNFLCMTTELQSSIVEPDSAAVFTIALSLWEICEKQSRADGFNISECYNGVDQFMREVMRIANQFENWACCHVDFNEFSEVWAYYLGDNFGNVCLSVLSLSCLMEFNKDDCLRIALQLNLPVIISGNLPVPIDLTVPNPIPAAVFCEFRIQTVRDSLQDNEPKPFVAGDEPFDENFNGVYFSLYGIESNGRLEHIADRRTYEQVLDLAQKIAPSISFPVSPTFTTKCAISGMVA